MPVPDSITCIDCGGTCYRMPFDPPELGWVRGQVITFRCKDCNDMWYLEVTADDLGEAENDAPDWF